jgi:RecB family exonuclease
MEIKRTKPLEILKVSCSALKTYEQCPRKYYYSYILKPVIEKKDWAHLTLGTFVHEVLELFHNKLKIDIGQDRKKLMTHASQATKNEKVKGKPKHKLNPEIIKEAKDILTAYLVYLERNGIPNVDANEKSFSVIIDEDILVRGVIDRIDIATDGSHRFHIWDYKTGKSKYLDEFQLLVYGIPLLEEYRDLEEYKASYLALKENMKEISYTFTRTDVEKVKDEIREIAKQIREDKTWEPRPQFLCKYCDYSPICDAAPKERVQPGQAAGGEIEW